MQFTSTPLDKGLHPDQSVLPLDAALIAYLPPLAQIQTTLGPVSARIDADTIRRYLFPEGKARWVERLDTPLGSSGAFFIPWFADELGTIPAEALRRAVLQAIEQASQFGAPVVSLAGMLPAYTRYGYALLDNDQTMSQNLTGFWKPVRSIPVLTTGHSTTVVAVVKSVLAALGAMGQPLATLQLGCLGLGSIGSAALQLLLKVAGHPAGLTLCDVEGSGARLRVLVTTLRQELDYQGQVRIIAVADHTNHPVPDELYAVDLVIGGTGATGATNRPNVLDVDRLAPGTVVVDDSFPACFAVERAIVRMKGAQDVLLVGGGLLDCGPIQRMIHLPLAHPGLGEQIAGQLIADAVASCQLEALLWAREPTLPLTQGVATRSSALAYWHGAKTMGITAAPLHLREFRIEESLLRNIRKIIAKQES